MTRTYLKKKFRLKKRFQSEQTQVVPKETQQLTAFTQQPINFHKKGKNQVIHDCSQQTRVYTRKSQRKPRVYATVNQKPAYRKKRCIKTRQADRLRQTLLQSDSTRHTCPQTRHRNKRERAIQIH